MGNIAAATSTADPTQTDHDTDAADSRYQLPAVVCEPWCREGDGHTREFSAEDQWCTSEAEARVPMTRERKVEVDHGVWALDDMRVYAERRFEGRPHVVLHRGEMPGVELTASEAIELGEALVSFGRMVEAGQ